LSPKKTPQRKKEIPISNLLNLPPLYNPLGGKTSERERGGGERGMMAILIDALGGRGMKGRGVKAEG